jgi:capsular polysaccharide transport system permease protein
MSAENARNIAWKRALAISEELRKSARAIRQSKSTAVSVWGAGGGYQTFKAPRNWMRFAFLALGWLLPMILSLAYINFALSNQYMSEARFAVRGGERVTADPVAAVTGMASITQAQDTLIVVNYVKSRAIVEELERSVSLRALFSRRDVDWLSRFDEDDAVEDLVKYWRWKIRTDVESPSGIITVQVKAFSPEDALTIANAIVSSSEQLINTLSTRARQDAVQAARSELARAEKRLESVRVALRDLRNAQSTLDPRQTAEGINKLVGELRLERARLEQDADAARRSRIAESAPQMQFLRVRIQVVADQIRDLERQLTSATPTDLAVSGKITRFDELELERQVSEKQYTLAAAEFEGARMNAERQKMYLATFVTPVLARDVDWPKRTWLSAAAVITVTVLYWIGLMLLAWLERSLGIHLLGRGR